MAEKFLKQAKNIARASIYDDARYLGTWNGYEVYEPIFNDNILAKLVDLKHCILAFSKSNSSQNFIL